MDGWVDGYLDGKSPHSTGLRPLLGPLLKKCIFFISLLLLSGQEGKSNLHIAVLKSKFI